jgi:hypothetical protein
MQLMILLTFILMATLVLHDFDLQLAYGYDLLSFMVRCFIRIHSVVTHR